MSTINSFLQLPLRFAQDKLQFDLEICLELHWQEHFNQGDYAGQWTGIALRSPTGKMDDLSAPPDSSYVNTLLLEKCAYFRELAGTFQCEKETIRLLRLAPGSVIKEHRDRGAGYAFGIFRLHIPIRTEAGVAFVVNGCEVPMKSGECWYADFDLPHSVANHSSRDRIHLVLDCRRYEWSDQLFRKAGYDFQEETRRRAPDTETKKRMVEELARMDSVTARSLIQELKDGTDAGPPII